MPIRLLRPVDLLRCQRIRKLAAGRKGGLLLRDATQYRTTRLKLSKALRPAFRRCSAPSSDQKWNLNVVRSPENRRILVVFPSSLGWMAMIGAGDVLMQLTIAHRSSRAAQRALQPALLRAATRGSFNEELISRLQDYALGSTVDFRDVEVDLQGLSPFRRRVAHHCRRIPYGRTLTYGQLAAKAGSPGAARAVGNCMAANHIPLIIPCHRVVLSGGRIGAFSAPGGSRTKQRLLAIEAAVKQSRPDHLAATGPCGS